MNERKEDLILYRLQRSYESLVEAKAMIEIKHWNAAVNRLYYACFYSVIALLMKFDLPAHTHAGVRSLFGLNFIKTGKISKELGTLYNDLFDYRQTGDYKDLYNFEGQLVVSLFNPVEHFIEQISNLINNSN